MAFALWVILGLLGGALFIWLSRKLDREKEVFGISLIVAGLWYVSFGVYAGENIDVLLPQILGGMVYIGFAIAGLLSSILFLSIGWVLHVVWDFGSPHFSDVAYIPYWVAPSCLGFDLLVGGYLFLRYRNRFPIQN